MDWCHHLEECVRLWSVCRWLCVGVCVSVLEDSCFLGLLWSYECVSATNCHHVTLCTLTHWAVATSPQTPFFFLKRHPLTNAAPLLNDGIAPLLSLYLSSFISFSFSESERQPPPPFFPPSVLLPLSMRPLFSAFQSWTGGLSVPRSHWPNLTHMLTEWAAPAPLSAPALWVFTWNNSTAAVGREQGPGRRQTESEGEPASPKWTWLTYSNISFVSFLSTFLLFCSYLIKVVLTCLWCEEPFVWSLSGSFFSLGVVKLFSVFFFWFFTLVSKSVTASGWPEECVIIRAGRKLIFVLTCCAGRAREIGCLNSFWGCLWERLQTLGGYAVWKAFCWAEACNCLSNPSLSFFYTHTVICFC